MGWKFCQVTEINKNKQTNKQAIFLKKKLNLLRGQQKFGILNAALFDQFLKSVLLRIICESGPLHGTRLFIRFYSLYETKIVQYLKRQDTMV